MLAESVRVIHTRDTKLGEAEEALCVLQGLLRKIIADNADIKVMASSAFNTAEYARGLVYEQSKEQGFLAWKRNSAHSLATAITMLFRTALQS